MMEGGKTRPLEPIPASALHVVIDIQRLFAEQTEWHTPAIGDILPAVLHLSAAKPDRTVYARFMTPSSPSQAEGRWRAYYERWISVTGDRMESGMLDLIEPLAALAGPGSTVDKTTYSVFGSPVFLRMLADRSVDTLVFTGVETDVCVLASIFDAVDHGFRVVVPTDAVASSDRASHHAVLRHVLPRLVDHVDLTTVEDVLRSWPA